MADSGPVTADEIEAWRGYVGRSETRRQVLDVEALRRFAAAVGSDLDVLRTTPPLAHWAWFLETVPAQGLGRDGHALRGLGVLPPIRLPRRMFASAAMTFQAPLALGAPAEMTLTLASVTHRPGRSGELVFVEVDRRLTQDGRARLTERQTLVYRDVGQAAPAVRPGDVAVSADDVLWTPGAVDLFRFSAVTFNAHRIHYDLAYARDEEGYPGLVVQGPFTAVKLCARALGTRPAEDLRRFSFRASAPLFADQPVRLRAGPEPGAVEAVRGDGVVAMSARAELAPNHQNDFGSPST